MAIASGSFVIGDRYDVGEVLGRGGMGEVRRARDTRLDRDVAIKFLRADLAAQPDARSRFEDEALNAGRLTHPNVVLVFDSGEHEGTPYLVMECLPGRTLKDELVDGPLPPARVTWIVRDILAALAAAHAMGIVHRDVSPRNILLTETGRAKLADFGIAKAAEGPSVTVVGQVLGTPAYLAPERLRGEPATPAADVYGMGATLYEALSGSPPFRGDSAIAIATQAATTRPERLEHLRPDIPVELVAAVDHAMDPDPEARPTAEELAASLGGETELAAETTAVPVVETGVDTSALGVVEAVPTIAAPVVVAPGERFRRGWYDRRALLATVGIAALAGLLLLAATDRAGSPAAPARAEETATTASPTTVVTRAPTTAAPVVRVRITAAPKPEGKREAGKAKHGKD